MNSYNPETPVKQSRLYGLDHLRTLAITLVFIFHYSRLFPHPGWMDLVSKFGWTGVDLFFVLSGYLISSQLFEGIATQNTIRSKEFFLKRLFRIVPPYIVVVATYFCFPYVHEREGLAPLWKYLTFTLNLGLDLRTQGTFSHAWSLCIEEQFYLILPLILIFLVQFNLFKKSYWILIVLFLAGFVIRYVAYNQFVLPHIEEEDSWAYWYRQIYYPTYCRLDGLLVGVAIAALLQFKPRIKERLSQYGNLLLLLSFFILVCAYFICMDEESITATVYGFPFVSLGYGVMVLAAVCERSVLYKFRLVATSFIASWSYAVYLVHKFVIHIAQDQFAKFKLSKDSTVMFLICTLTVLAVAWAMNKIVERPFLKLRNRILNK